MKNRKKKFLPLAPKNLKITENFTKYCKVLNLGVKKFLMVMGNWTTNFDF